MARVRARQWSIDHRAFLMRPFKVYEHQLFAIQGVLEHFLDARLFAIKMS